MHYLLHTFYRVLLCTQPFVRRSKTKPASVWGFVG